MRILQGCGDGDSRVAYGLHLLVFGIHSIRGFLLLRKAHCCRSGLV